MYLFSVPEHRLTRSRSITPDSSLHAYNLSPTISTRHAVVISSPSTGQTRGFANDDSSLAEPANVRTDGRAAMSVAKQSFFIVVPYALTIADKVHLVV